MMLESRGEDEVEVSMALIWVRLGFDYVEMNE